MFQFRQIEVNDYLYLKIQIKYKTCVMWIFELWDICKEKVFIFFNSALFFSTLF